MGPLPLFVGIGLIVIALVVGALAVLIIAFPGCNRQKFFQRRFWAWGVLFLLALAALPVWFEIPLLAIAPLAAALLISIPLFGEWLDRNRHEMPLKSLPDKTKARVDPTMATIFGAVIGCVVGIALGLWPPQFIEPWPENVFVRVGVYTTLVTMVSGLMSRHAARIENQRNGYDIEGRSSK